jgi:hypothetical protein
MAAARQFPPSIPESSPVVADRIFARLFNLDYFGSLPLGMSCLENREVTKNLRIKRVELHTKSA